MKTPTLSVQREKQKKLLLLDFLSIPILMRSRAVGIDKRQNGFVKLYIFQFVLLNFFKAIIG